MTRAEPELVVPLKTTLHLHFIKELSAQTQQESVRVGGAPSEKSDGGAQSSRGERQHGRRSYMEHVKIGELQAFSDILESLDFIRSILKGPAPSGGV